MSERNFVCEVDILKFSPRGAEVGILVLNWQTGQTFWVYMTRREHATWDAEWTKNGKPNRVHYAVSDHREVLCNMKVTPSRLVRAA